MSVAAPESDTLRRYKPGQYWRLLGKHAQNPKDEKHPAPKYYDGYPEQGRYKNKLMDGTLVPVALYPHPQYPEQWIALVGGLQANDVNEVWKSCHRHYCSEADYDFWMLNRHWPEQQIIADGALAKPASDQFPVDDLVEKPVAETLPAEIKRVEDWFAKLGNKITSEDIAIRAAANAETIRKLRLGAEKAQKAAIGDHYKLYKEAYDKFQPDIKAAEALQGKLEKAALAFGAAERARLAEEQRKAQAAIDEANRKVQAQAIQAAAEALAAMPKKQRTEEAAAALVAQHMPAPVVAPAAEPLPVLPAKIGTGRGLSLEAKYVAKVTDWDALYMAHREDPKVRAVLLEIANRCARENKPCAGMERVEEGAQ